VTTPYRDKERQKKRGDITGKEGVYYRDMHI
jgi:hypothetical protein